MTVICKLAFLFNYLRRHLTSGEGIVMLGICVCVCVSVCPTEPRLHAALASAAKVLHCIQCSLARGVFY